jgi:hypothetical protein
MNTFKIFNDILLSEGEQILLSEGEQILLQGKYNDAAKYYNNWFKRYDIINKMKINSQHSIFNKKLKKKLPNIIHAFMGCHNNEYKNYIKDIMSTGNYLVFEDFRNNNVFHLAASYNNCKNYETYENLFNLINSMKRQDLLLKKNFSNDTPIELAFLNDNKDFIILAKKICNKPQKSEIERMNNLGYYAYLKDYVDPDIMSLLSI